MTGLLESDLVAYSKVAVRLILARFPEWEAFAKIAPPGGWCGLRGRVQHPVSVAGRRIRTVGVHGG